MPFILINGDYTGVHAILVSTSYGGRHEVVAGTMLAGAHEVKASTSIRGEHEVQASTMPEQEGSHLVVARVRPEVTGRHEVRACTSPSDYSGRHEVRASCVAGHGTVRSGVAESWVLTQHSSVLGNKLKSWTYSRPDGLGVSLQCTFDGLHASMSDGLQRITVVATNKANGQRLSFTTERLQGNGASSTRTTRSGSDTQLNFTSPIQKKLGAPLPELIPWAGMPEEGRGGASCSQKKALRKRKPVRSVLQEAIQAADLQVRFLPGSFGSAFSGEIIQGTSSDYSTSGKTLQQVLNDFYGKLGATFATLDNDTLLVIAPGGNKGSAGVSSSTLRRYCEETSSNTPYREPLGFLKLTGMPEEANFASFDLSGDPDQAAKEFELSKNYIDRSETSTPGGTTYSSVQKEGGKVVREGTVVISTVTVKAPEGKKLPDRVFTRVPISETNTYKQYSSTCEGQLTSTYQKHREWAYPFNAQLQQAILSIPGYQFGTSAGQLLSESTTQVLYEWSPQGWLKRRLTLTTKTGSLAVENMGTVNEQFTTGLRVNTVTEETWLPIGNGQWIYKTTTSGDQLVPVFDKTGKSWVGVEKKSGVISSQSETTDNAPDSSSCQCDEDTILIPREHEHVNPYGSGRQEEDFPTETNLEGLANYILENSKVRKTREWKVCLPIPVAYREVIDGYTITGIQASMQSAAGFSMTITGEVILP